MNLFDEIMSANDRAGIPLVEVSQICTVGSRGSNSYKASEFVEPHKGAIIISPPNIIRNKLVLDDVGYYSMDGYVQKPEFQVAVGDIIFCKMASAGMPFKAAIVDYLPEPAITNPNVLLIKNIRCNPRYFHAVLTSGAFQDQLISTRQGATIQTVPVKDLLSMKIPLPSEAEQKRIIELHSRYSEAYNELADNLQKELEMRQAQFKYHIDHLIWHL